MEIYYYYPNKMLSFNYGHYSSYRKYEVGNTKRFEDYDVTSKVTQDEQTARFSHEIKI